MTYEDTLNYLFGQLPMYQRNGKAAYKANLDNTLKLDRHLAYPHKAFKSIHIAGTNGKGSSSHMLASILQESGYKVGLYTSPHLKDFRERIKVNGKKIPRKKVCQFVEFHRNIFELWQLSFFEWTVGLCFDYFKEEQVDIAIIEVGLGGRLDSTNVISPIACLITNIGLDHQQFLGNTKQKISKEKAGIIKPKTPVVISETQPETQSVFKETAKRQNAEIIFAEDLNHQPYPSDLLGKYQLKNQKGVLTLLPLLRTLGYKINEDAVKKGLLNVTKNTGLNGRWQILKQVPMTICDTAHNIEGLQLVIEQLNSLPAKNLHLILGFVNDKNVKEILRLFPRSAKYYLCEPNLPRALPLEQLIQLGNELKINFNSTKNVASALQSARESAHPNDVIFIGGSTFVVAEIL